MNSMNDKRVMMLDLVELYSWIKLSKFPTDMFDKDIKRICKKYMVEDTEKFLVEFDKLFDTNQVHGYLDGVVTEMAGK